MSEEELCRKSGGRGTRYIKTYCEANTTDDRIYGGNDGFPSFHTVALFQSTIIEQVKFVINRFDVPSFVDPAAPIAELALAGGHVDPHIDCQSGFFSCFP